MLVASWVFCVSQPTIGCGDAYCSWKLHKFANVNLRRSYVYAGNRDVATSTLSRRFTILLRLTSPSRLCKAITIAFAPFRLTCRQRDIQLWKPMSFCAVAAFTLSIYFVTAVAILLDQLQFYCGNFTDYSWISFAAFLSSMHHRWSMRTRLIRLLQRPYIWPLNGLKRPCLALLRA